MNLVPVVAAHDAKPEVKEAAEYVCDGVADEVELQAAFDRYGALELTEGTYNLSSPLITEPHINGTTVTEE